MKPYHGIKHKKLRLVLVFEKKTLKNKESLYVQ